MICTTHPCQDEEYEREAHRLLHFPKVAIITLISEGPCEMNQMHPMPRMDHRWMILSMFVVCTALGCGSPTWRSDRPDAPPPIDIAPQCASEGPVSVIATSAQDFDLRQFEGGPVLLRSGNHLLELQHGRVLLHEPVGPSPRADGRYRLTGRWPNDLFVVLSDHPLSSIWGETDTPWARFRDGRWEPLHSRAPTLVLPWVQGRYLAFFQPFIVSGSVRELSPRVELGPTPPGIDPAMFIEDLATDADGNALLIGVCDGDVCAQRAEGGHFLPVEKLPVAGPSDLQAFVTNDELIALGDFDGGSWGAVFDANGWTALNMPTEHPLVRRADAGPTGDVWISAGRAEQSSLETELYVRDGAAFERVAIPTSCVSPGARLGIWQIVVDNDGGAYVAALAGSGMELLYVRHPMH